MNKKETPLVVETDGAKTGIAKDFKKYYIPQKVKSQVDYYLSLGLTPIPVVPFGKACFILDWQLKTPTELWTTFRSNIGLRMGDGLICIDADTPETVKLFDPMFKQQTKVRTRKGAHYYFKCNPLFDYDAAKKIKEEHGLGGEFRMYGSYVVAPISFVSMNGYTHLYKLEKGSFDKIPHLDPNRLHELIEEYTNWKLVPKKVEQSNEPTVSLTSLYIPTKYKPTTKIIDDKVEWLQGANKGDSAKFGNTTYSSRSEVYFSVISILIRYNWTETAIFDLIGNLDNKQNYFNNTYMAVVNYLEGKQIVDDLHKLYFIDHPTKAESLVFKALVSMVYQKLNYEVSTSNAELRRLTGIKHNKTITRTLDKLVSRDLISRDGWNITMFTWSDNYTSRMYLDLSNHVNVDNLPQLSDIVEVLNLQYVLGEETIALLSKLSLTPNTLTDLANLTGKSVRTTFYHLKKLQNLGIIETSKKGRFSYYYLVGNYQLKLYEAMSDHMNENHLKIAEQQAKYNEFIMQTDLYEKLKATYGPDEALKRLKQIMHG